LQCLKSQLTTTILLLFFSYTNLFAQYAGDGIHVADDNISIYYTESLIDDLCEDVLGLPFLPTSSDEDVEVDATSVKRIVHQTVILKSILICTKYVKLDSILHLQSFDRLDNFSCPIVLKLRYSNAVLTTPI
jgi:hypothetical protein